MKFGLLSYSKSRNFGDQIQSLAAKQYLPQVDHLLDRDFLNEYSGDITKLIMNGWFMAKPENWPPSEKINPLLISFHITHDYNANEKLFSNEAIEFYKKNGPVGCRDYYTLELLKSHGIDAYYSGCLTLTLTNRYKELPKTDDIFIVDVLYKVGGKTREWLGRIRKKWFLKKIIPSNVLDKAIYMRQDVPKGTTEEEKFQLAEEALKKYATAKLVITSRIHCALPCIALGTPVIFIDGGLEKPTDQTRLKGIMEYMNSYNIDHINKAYKGWVNALFKDTEYDNPLGINWDNPPDNPNNHLEVASKLKEKCEAFIQENL